MPLQTLHNGRDPVSNGGSGTDDRSLVLPFRIMSESLLVVAARKMIRRGKGERWLRPLAVRMVTLAGRDPTVRVQMVFDSGARFEFPAADRVWRRFATRGAYVYEADVMRVLALLSDMKSAFFDLGANFGYWSVVALHFGWRPVVAVEASRETFLHLRENAALNGNAFTPLHAAVYASDGLELGLSEALTHDRRHLTSTMPAEKVKSLSLDTLLERHAPEGRVIIKMDIEGAELEALRGATKLWDRDAVLIYEDTHRDRENALGEYLLQREDWQVFGLIDRRDSLWAHDVGITRVATLADIERIKAEKFGKNFVAARKGSPLHARLLAASA